MHLHQPDRIMGPSMKQTSNALAAQGSPATVRLRRCMGRARAAVCGAGLTSLRWLRSLASLSTNSSTVNVPSPGARNYWELCGIVNNYLELSGIDRAQ